MTMEIRIPGASCTHTPFAIRDSDGLFVFCAAGASSQAMNIWLISENEPPTEVVASAAVSAYGLCSPWVEKSADGFVMYVTVFAPGPNEYTVAMFTSTDIRGPYRLIARDVLNIGASYHSPCAINNGLYYVKGSPSRGEVGGLLFFDFGSGAVFECEVEPPTFTVRAVYKPNVFRTEVDQLCMFMTEIDSEGVYRQGYFVSDSKGLSWRRLGEIKLSTDYAYKPFLYKGNLIQVIKNGGALATNVYAVSHLEAIKIKLNDLCSEFSNYPTDYDIPVLNTLAVR